MPLEIGLGYTRGCRSTFCGDAAALMSDIYQDHKDEDGFLYITYSGENTFGNKDTGMLALM